MAQYQTVIYDVASGSILKVIPNTYIASRPRLASLAGRRHWQGISFLYFHHDMSLDLPSLKVRRLSPNMPASIVSTDGIPLDFKAIMHSRQKSLSAGVNCLVEFEGGMGDQLMEAAAVLLSVSKYKSSSFAVKALPQFVEILRRVPGIPPVASSYVGQSKDDFTFTVSNHTSYMSDPRGGHFGKASLYGAWLGLNRVSKVVKIKLTKSDYLSESSFFAGLPLADRRHNFMCQFRSGSGHAKSWQHQKVLRLSELLHQSFDCNVFVVGSPREIPRGAPHIIDLTGKTSWWQTCLLESKMDLVVCIDSGVMHLARSLGIPYIALWGGTNAQLILGEDEQPHDIRLDLPCRDLVCYDCQNKTNACMEKITPEMVFDHARVLLHHPGDGQPGS
jgi:hypothetical protein